MTPSTTGPYHRSMEFTRRASSILGVATAGKALVIATRPKQWTKNLTIYLALFFTVNEAWDPGDMGEILSLASKTTLAFFIFSALSGAVYLFNDIFDIERDRSHPKKRFRPIASGRLPIPAAWIGTVTLAAGGLGLAFLLEPLFGWVALAYAVIMVAYTLVLRDIILLDVFAISTGFVLRVIAGAAVLQLPISNWLYICTGLGALFIALAKRRSELVMSGGDAGSRRGTLEHYTLDVLNQFITVVATAAILAYSLYTFTAPNLPKNLAMMVTIPFVVFGVFRYMYLVRVKNMGESPEDILITDAPLLIAIMLWLATAATILIMFRG